MTIHTSPSPTSHDHVTARPCHAVRTHQPMTLQPSPSPSVPRDASLPSGPRHMTDRVATLLATPTDRVPPGRPVPSDRPSQDVPSRHDRPIRPGPSDRPHLAPVTPPRTTDLISSDLTVIDSPHLVASPQTVETVHPSPNRRATNLSKPNRHDRPSRPVPNDSPLHICPPRSTILASLGPRHAVTTIRSTTCQSEPSRHAVPARTVTTNRSQPRRTAPVHPTIRP